MMKKTKILLATMAVLAAISPAYGQQRMPGEVPTPQATDLGRFGDVPVSLYTGSVGISIPLFSTTVRGVTLNASLDYDGSGVRVNSLPGPMGTSWTLNCGGVITRSANGGYDEYQQPVLLYQECPVLPYFDYDSYHGVLEAAASATSLQATTAWHNRPFHDYEPDIFHFNFMGMTGSFFLGNDGQWKVCSDHDIDVLLDIADDSNFDYPLYRYFPGLHPSSTQHSPESVSKTIKTIVLRDDQGNTYKFGGDNSSVEYSIGLLDMCEGKKKHSWKADAWYLTEVKDKYGNSLYEFRYGRGKYVAQLSNGYEAFGYNDGGAMGWSIDGHYSSSYSYADTRFPYGVTINVPVYLDTVICNNGVTFKLECEYCPQSFAQLFPSFCSHVGPLSTIYDMTGYVSGQTLLPFYYLQTNDEGFTSHQYLTPVTDKINDPLSVTRPKRYKRFLVIGGKDYLFHYDDMGRTFLDRMDVRNPGSDTLLATYRFRYDNNHLVPADCSTRMADHWGYYNGRGYSLPTTEAGYRAFKPLRDPDTAMVKYGSLTSIVYPTGGAAVIAYGPHRFSRCVTRYGLSMRDTTGVAGGLRVQSVTLYDDTTRTRVLSRKTYNYDLSDGSSSGELAGQPVYYWENWAADPADPSTTASVTLFRTASIVPLSNAFGPHVGYTRVTETNLDGSRTVYSFSNFSGNPDYGQGIDFNGHRPSPYGLHTDRGYRRGKLLSRAVFSPAGTVQESQSFSYGDGQEETQYVLAASVNLVGGLSSGATAYYTGGSYKLFYPDYDLASETKTLHPDGLTTSRTFSRSSETVAIASPYPHDATARILHAETTTRGSESLRMEYGYPTDGGIPSPVSLLATKWFDLRPYWTKAFHNGAETQADSITFLSRTVNGMSHPMPRYELSRKGGEATDTLIMYSNYTSTGQLKLYTRQGEPSTLLFWACNDNYLVGSSLNGGANDINAYDNSNCFNRDYMVGVFNNYRQGHPYEQVTSYTWLPVLGVTSITDPRGNTVYYEYDEAFRLSATLDLFRKTISTYDYHYRQIP